MKRERQKEKEALRKGKFIVEPYPKQNESWGNTMEHPSFLVPTGNTGVFDDLARWRRGRSSHFVPGLGRRMFGSEQGLDALPDAFGRAFGRGSRRLLRRGMRRSPRRSRHLKRRRPGAQLSADQKRREPRLEKSPRKRKSEMMLRIISDLLAQRRRGAQAISERRAGSPEWRFRSNSDNNTFVWGISRGSWEGFRLSGSY